MAAITADYPPKTGASSREVSAKHKVYHSHIIFSEKCWNFRSKNWLWLNLLCLCVGSNQRKLSSEAAWWSDYID